MLGHLEHPLARHVFAAQDVLKKRQNVVRTLRPTEADDQDRVVDVRHGLVRWKSEESPEKMTPTGLEPVLPA